jgi:cytochrome b561
VVAQAAEYDTGAKSFHWLTVVLLGSQFIIGWIMPGVRHDTQPQGLISLHFSMGIVILAVTAARLLWRLAFGVPRPKRDCRDGSIRLRKPCTRYSMCCCLRLFLAAGLTPPVTVSP